MEECFLDPHNTAQLLLVSPPPSPLLSSPADRLLVGISITRYGVRQMRGLDTATVMLLAVVPGIYGWGWGEFLVRKMGKCVSGREIISYKNRIKV